jgi:hypothetical protein
MRSIRLVLVVLAFAAALALPTTPASAAGCVHINRIFYNSPGPDDGSNKSLNGEWVILHNVCAKGRSLHGWTLRDKSGNTYDRFGRFHLGPGKHVTIHTGKGSNTATDRFWGRVGYVWNNSSDIGTLRNANKVIQSRCSYFDPNKNYTLC